MESKGGRRESSASLAAICARMGGRGKHICILRLGAFSARATTP